MAVQAGVLRILWAWIRANWIPGESYHIHEALGLPKDPSPGTYDTDLFLPDAYPSLVEEPRWAFRLADIRMYGMLR